MTRRWQKDANHILHLHLDAAGIHTGMASQIFIRKQWFVDQKLHMVAGIIHQSHHADRARADMQVPFHILSDKIDELFTEQTAIRTAKKEEIITGPATIRCFVDNEVREFDIEVTQVDMMSQEINKGLVIKVTDEELLEKTGGIIQGMSGSPIIQNGKLIGAVTHVFVQDSTKGYGIFIENMLKQVNLPEMCG